MLPMTPSIFQPSLFRLIPFVALLLLSLMLFGCGSAEERKAAYLSEAEDYIEAGNFPKARVSLRNASKIDPKDAKIYFLLAQVAEKEKNWQEAFGHYFQTSELDPTHHLAMVRLGRFYLAGNQQSELSDVVQKLLALNAQDTAGLALQATLTHTKGDASQALTQAQAVLSLKPTEPDTFILLAAVFSAEKQFAQSISLLKEGISQHPQNIDLMSNLALTYVRTEAITDAEPVYRQLINLEPTVFGHREKLAQVYVFFNMPDKASSLLQEAVDLEPESEERWVALIQHVDKTEREATLLKAREALPHSTKVLFALAEDYQRNQQDQKAREVYEEIVSDEENTAPGLQAQVMLAEMAWAQQDLVSTQAKLEAVLKESPRQPQALILKGTIALAQREGEEAVQAFRAVLKDDPNSSRIQSLLGQGYLIAGDRELAQESFEQALSLNAHELEAQMAMARIAMAEQNIPKALEHLNVILKDRPNHLESLKTLFSLHLRQRNWEATEHTLTRLKQAKISLFAFEIANGQLALARKQLDQASQAFLRAHKEKPKNMVPLTALVATYTTQKKNAQARQFFRQLAESDPAHPFANGFLAALQMQKKHYSEAHAAFAKQTEINPAWIPPWQDWANLHLRQGDQDEAFSTLLSGLSHNPDNLSLRMFLALMYEKHQRHDLAIKEYEIVLEKNPKIIGAANNLAFLLANHKGDPASLERAMDLTKSFEAKTENPLLLDTLGWVYYKMGHDQLALSIMRKAIAKAPDHPQLNYHMGLVSLKVGDPIEAKNYLQKAVKGNVAFDGLQEAKDVLATL